MRAILAGAVESSRVALEAIARTPGWTLPLVISLPRELDGRHSDFADLSGPARAAGAEFLATRNINTPETLDAITAARSEGRRVGKGGVRPGESRCWRWTIK